MDTEKVISKWFGALHKHIGKGHEINMEIAEALLVQANNHKVGDLVLGLWNARHIEMPGEMQYAQFECCVVRSATETDKGKKYVLMYHDRLDGRVEPAFDSNGFEMAPLDANFRCPLYEKYGDELLSTLILCERAIDSASLAPLQDFDF